ncbi:MAG: hypothetical protein K8I82_06100 [Anaerolineae bacterium]|nr:hypothetical protein [Anaerolineae bacterium]
MKDLIEQIGLQPEHFDILIILVIIVGSIWAVIRLYRDVSGQPREDLADLYPENEDNYD